jgi:hypothetical protein
MSEADYYLYVHAKKDNGDVFYVGKGKRRRAWHTNRNKMWKAIADKHGFVPIMIRSGLSDDQALAQEVRLIHAYRSAGVVLANMTDGGEGMSGMVHTEEHKKKMSVIMRGRAFSQKTRQKMSESAKARNATSNQLFTSDNNPMKRSECKEKNSKAQLGKVISEQHRQKISKSLMGRESPNKGKTFSKEWTARMSASAKGRPKSEEHKAKIRAALIARAKKSKAGELQ